MDRKMEGVALLVLEKLERFLAQEENIDPQKCKHITATLKDLRELQSETHGPGQIVVVFDQAAEEAAG